ncbi:uncharacterized protein EDB91DRAFT_1085945 [Suillus paluster]|uniref:uncharacterized protein n=1 Tax=Suillus paluster TaxID=48578 RepID=UPI001B86B907|nr:uncharacterized protein EDB91DRAFT_1085945 [Suillus paluster]KAG1728863.1 hypothetical protein EDB91DRAFT_1085945 [Suillus paluster]
MVHAKDIPPDTENQQDDGNVEGMQSEHRKTSTTNVHSQQSARRRIAQLEEKLEALESGRVVKEKYDRCDRTYYSIIHFSDSQGRAIRRIVALFDNVEDLIAENDRRYEGGDEDHTIDQDRLQIGNGSEMEHDEYTQMLKMLRQGADSARGDDTSKLKALVSEWVNREFKPDSPVDSNDKHTRGFSNDACGRLLCPAELDWNNPVVRAGIRDCSEGYIVTDLSFPAYLYDGYTANLDDLEEGLFKGKILIQGYKAVFMSPSSAKDVEGDGDGADIIQNNRRARKSFNGAKVKKHVAQIINMKKVTPHSIAYIACLVGHSIWQGLILTFFGYIMARRVNKLLEWWSRKVFGWSHHNNISDVAKARMSVNALTMQRAQHDDAAFDSA